MRIKLEIPLSTGKISEITSGKLLCDSSITIYHITTDSRETEKGDLFIALQGKNTNGENYTNDVISKGAIALTSKEQNGAIVVSDTVNALLKIASFYIKTLPYLLYNIGITGSVGKTTTKEFMKIILSSKYKVHSTKGNFNNEIGLPLSILSAPRETQVLIIELGMNHSGEIKRLAHCLDPNIAVITNIGRAHIGNLGSKEAIAKEKLDILSEMEKPLVFVPLEEELLQNTQGKITISTQNDSADFYVEKDDNGIIYLTNNGEKNAYGFFALKEEHHLKCLSFAVSVSKFLDIDNEKISKSIVLISADNTRQNIFFTKKRYFLDDSYNASPESVIACIKSAEGLVGYCRKSLLLGDMLELGEMSSMIHYEIGEMISQDHFYNLFLFGCEAEKIGFAAINSGFPADRVYTNTDISDPYKTATDLFYATIDGEIIIMKASHSINLERIIRIFEKEV